MPMSPYVALGLTTLLVCASSLLSASEQTTENQSDLIGLATLSPDFPMMELLAEDMVRKLGSRDIDAEYIMRDATSEQIRPSPEAQLLLAGLDTFIEQWDNDNEAGASALLGSLKPVAEVVRDHQAFLMLHTRNAQELRSRFAMAHGADGPMPLGGLTPPGHRDHLVAMMLMDTVGQDATLYPYRQYDSLDALAIGLLTGEIRLASIPVSQALQMSLEGGIKIVAISSGRRQDVMTSVPTLISARIDLNFSNYIGLYRKDSDESDNIGRWSDALSDLSSDEDWPERVFDLGLVDDYVNEGTFAVNVLRELARLKRFSQMLE